MNHQEKTSVFISVDGIDGVGKSTQLERLNDYLRDRGADVLLVRDPGSTELGARLREILLGSNLEMHRRTEAMLFMASRCEMVEAIIKPAIAKGLTVVSDRFLLANVVYQSIGGTVAADQLWELGLLANGNLRPDLTLLFDMPAADAAARMCGPADRMESRGIEYMESVRQAFLRELPKSSPEVAVIDAGRSPEEVTKQMLDLELPQLMVMTILSSVLAPVS